MWKIHRDDIFKYMLKYISVTVIFLHYFEPWKFSFRAVNFQMVHHVLIVILVITAHLPHQVRYHAQVVLTLVHLVYHLVSCVLQVIDVQMLLMTRFLVM